MTTKAERGASSTVDTPTTTSGPSTDNPGLSAKRPADEAAAVRYQERLQAQYGEYGQWVAGQDIYHEGALAYAAGHPIPAALVDADRRVVTSMHRCHHGATGDQRCDRFNTADEWSEPGLAVRPVGWTEDDA